MIRSRKQASRSWVLRVAALRAASLRAASLGVVCLALAGCSHLSADSPSETNDGVQTSQDPVVALLDGEPIHQSDIDRWLKDDWLRGIEENPAELYQLRRAGVQGVIDDALIDRAAAASELSSEAYLEQESATLGPVTEIEINDFYRRHQDRIQPAEPLETLRPKIRKFLEADRPVRVVSALRGAAQIEIVMLPPARPPVVRQEIPPGGTSRGPEQAPVTIVEWSDYQCPFCGRAEATLHQLDALFPGKLRFVYRHLPLEFHENALPAAKAAICAEQQSRFWDYHDLLFANQRALSAPQLLQYAQKLDLDEARFLTCLEADSTRERILADAAAGKSAGATATPTFFINGILLRGAQPLGAFRAIVEQELSQNPVARVAP